MEVVWATSSPTLADEEPALPFPPSYGWLDCGHGSMLDLEKVTSLE